MFWGRRHNFSFEARPILKCLYIATKQLLKTQYGIDRTFDRDESEWGVWYMVLGKPLKDFGEASMVAKTFLGTGLAGLTALYALQSLRIRYFLALSLVFTFAGLFMSVNLALWRFSPAKSSLARLRSVLFRTFRTEGREGGQAGRPTYCDDKCRQCRVGQPHTGLPFRPAFHSTAPKSGTSVAPVLAKGGA